LNSGADLGLIIDMENRPLEFSQYGETDTFVIEVTGPLVENNVSAFKAVFEQKTELAARLESPERDSIRFLDLGCGTGVDTHETADALRGCGVRNVLGVGITAEPLVVWIAKRVQTLGRSRATAPHSGGSTAHGRRGEVNFVVGDLFRPPVRGRFDLVVCNGVLGETVPATDANVNGLLDTVARILTPNGVFTLANRFHDGTLQTLDRVPRLAKGRAWHTDGGPRLWWLTR